MSVQLEPSGFNLAAGALGGFLCLYGALSYLIKERCFLSEAPLALFVGIAIERLNVIPHRIADPPDGTPSPLDSISLGFSHMVLGIQLVMVGIQLPDKYVVMHWRSMAMLLLPVMMVMWFATTAATMAVIPDVSLLVALAIASCATPTDPVLSNALVTGSFADQHISPRIRNLISAESGANDGFAYPFLFFALRLLSAPSAQSALLAWLLKTVIYQIGGAVVLGIGIGLAANRILRWATRHNTIDKESFLTYGIAVGIFTVGLGGFLDTDDLLAAFAAGSALTWDDWYRAETEEEGLESEVAVLMDTAFFMYVGATIPWESFNKEMTGLSAGRLLVLGVLVLLFRRLPVMLAAYRYIPSIKTMSEAAMMGYFGPIGAGSVFYASLVVEQVDGNDAYGTEGKRILELVKPVIYSLVLASIVGHSLIIPVVKIGLSWYGVGNVKLLGEEGDRLEREEGAESGEEDADDGASMTSASRSVNRSQRNAGGLEAQRTASTGPQMSQRSDEGRLYPPSKGAYLLDGEYVPEASWRMSSCHGPCTHPASSYRNADGTPRRDQRNFDDLLPRVNLPQQWNDRVRHLASSNDDDARRAAADPSSSVQHTTEHRADVAQDHARRGRDRQAENASQQPGARPIVTRASDTSDPMQANASTRGHRSNSVE